MRMLEVEVVYESKCLKRGNCFRFGDCSKCPDN